MGFHFFLQAAVFLYHCRGANAAQEGSQLESFHGADLQPGAINASWVGEEEAPSPNLLLKLPRMLEGWGGVGGSLRSVFQAQILLTLLHTALPTQPVLCCQKNLPKILPSYHSPAQKLPVVAPCCLRRAHLLCQHPQPPPASCLSVSVLRAPSGTSFVSLAPRSP